MSTRHAVLALCGREFSAVLTGNVGVKFEHGLLLDHHPSHPRIGDGEQQEESHDRTGAEVQKLDAKGKRQEDASREDVDGPFETHATDSCSSCLYLRCFIDRFSQSCSQG